MDDDSVLLERYELRDRLGRGGMASVYRAYDRQLERFVAIKLFAPGTAVDDARRRSEAALLARLSHPHLVALYDAHLAPAEDSTPSFLVMELVDGEDLRVRLERGPLRPDQAAEVAAAIAEALVLVHEAGMVHRDLKPANILLAESSVPGARPIVKLADFGIAHLVGAERLTTAGTIIGTAGYLSPEQVSGGEPGAAADVYSLGLVVLEALTGVREYPGTPVEAVAARLAREPRIPSSLPEDWRGLIGAMTAKDPSLRPTAFEVAVMARETASQLAGWSVTDDEETAPTTALAPGAAASSGGASGAVRPTTAGIVPSKPAPRRPNRSRRVLPIGAALGVVAVVAGSLALGSLMAPASAPAQTGQTGRTPRPTPSVTAPPSTVSPAVDSSTTSTPQQPSGPSPQQQTGPSPRQPKPDQPKKGDPKKDDPDKGPGKNNGTGGGKGNG